MFLAERTWPPGSSLGGLYGQQGHRAKAKQGPLPAEWAPPGARKGPFGDASVSFTFATEVSSLHFNPLLHPSAREPGFPIGKK